MRLVDCLLFKPGTTVTDVFNALKRGALGSVRLSGDFVRAEARALGVNSRVRVLGRDSTVDQSNAVIEISTNRKSAWQQHTKSSSIV